MIGNRQEVFSTFLGRRVVLFPPSSSCMQPSLIFSPLPFRPTSLVFPISCSIGNKVGSSGARARGHQSQPLFMSASQRPFLAEVARFAPRPRTHYKSGPARKHRKFLRTCVVLKQLRHEREPWRIGGEYREILPLSVSGGSRKEGRKEGRRDRRRRRRGGRRIGMMEVRCSVVWQRLRYGP